MRVINLAWSEFLDKIPATPDDGCRQCFIDTRDENLKSKFSYKEACEKTVHGDVSGVDGMRLAIDAITHAESAKSLAWTPSPVGSRVCVPAFLAGNPNDMRRRVKREMAHRTVRVVFDTTISMGITREQMVERGTVVVGLIEALQCMNISVDLQLVCSMSDGGSQGRAIVVNAPSNPVDLASAGFLLASPEFTRLVMYSVWYKTYNFPNEAPTTAAILRDALGLKPSDIFIPGVRYSDVANDLAFSKNPQAWILEKIQGITNAG